jgi:hypothetical protein
MTNAQAYANFSFSFPVSLFTLQSIGRGCSSINGNLQDVSKRLE